MGLGSYPEYHFRKIIPGDIDTVRRRLCDVLEEFNYVVVGDTPIEAKRINTRNIWVATILECQARLTIRLRSISPASTMATFDYAVEFLFTNADQKALEREAEALIALGTATTDSALCPSCGHESTGPGRFCRLCGAPVAAARLPAEIEVMRLQAGASASQQEFVTGLTIGILTLGLCLPWVINSPGSWVAWMFIVNGCLIAALCLIQALRRIQRTLNPKPPQSEPAELHQTQQEALPAPPFSITEGTTSLMDSPDPEPISVPRSRDTASND